MNTHRSMNDCCSDLVPINYYTLMLCCKTINNRNLNSNDKRQQTKGRKTEYFLGNGMKVKILSEIKPPLVDLAIQEPKKKLDKKEISR